jgi:predicted HAD superfamily Cof-like phosphohydrolase
MSQQTNFQKVNEFNNAFQVEREQSFTNNTFDNEKLINLRMNLIREEVQELEEAVQNRDRVEVIDALADILYVVYGMGDCIGVNLDEAFRRVHESNMTKLCPTKESAEATKQWYLENDKRYDTPEWRCVNVGEHEYYMVYNKSTGKVLKNKDYYAVDLNDMVPADDNQNTGE